MGYGDNDNIRRRIFYSIIMEAYITAIAYYLPEKVLTNEELVNEFPEWTVEKVAAKVGISGRHIAAQDEFVSDMAVKAASRLFSESGIDKCTIDFVLLCTQSPDYFLPTTACIVQDRLGLSTSAGALDFNLGCSGYVYGLALAKGLIVSGVAKKVLLLTSETYSKFIERQDKGNRTIFGDGASATIISTDGSYKIGEFTLGTDGSGANNLIVKNGAMRNARSADGGSPDDYLFMDGAEIFNFTIGAVPSLVRNTLEKNRLEMDDVDAFVFHQANQYMLSHLRKKIGIPPEKFILHMDSCGNTVSATIPIALKEGVSMVPASSSKHVLLAGFGVGYSWGAVILTKKAENK